MATNNITRMLEAQKVTFTTYELPVEKLDALKTARLLDVPPNQVFKTIVVTREKQGKPVLAVIPGTTEVDLKALAAFLGEKKMRLPTQREAEQLTGLQAGGISPLALIHRGFQVIIDQSAVSFDQIHISGGQRGLNIRMPVKTLIEITHARLAIIASPLKNLSEDLED